MKTLRDKIPKILPATIILLILLCVMPVISSGCHRGAPLAIDELKVVMPGDKPSEFEVYRVIAVKKDVTKQELVDLLGYFVRQYVNKNRVMIYVFNNSSAAHLGQSGGIVATYFQDKKMKKLERDILLDQPK